MLGDKADVPGRVAALHLDEKAKAAAGAVGAASKAAASKTAELSKAAAHATTESAKQLSQKTADGVAKLELGEKIGDVAGKAGETIKKGASSVVDVTKAASETVVDATKSGVESVAKASADLTRKSAAETPAIPSALDQLLAEEDAAAAPLTGDSAPLPATPAAITPAKPAPTLPLFAEVPETVPAQPSPKRASYRDLALERGGEADGMTAAEVAHVTAEAAAPTPAEDTAPNEPVPAPLAARWAALRTGFTAKIAALSSKVSATASDATASAGGAAGPSAWTYALAGAALIGAAMWGVSGKIPTQGGLNQAIGEASTPPLAAAGIERSDRAEIEAIVHDYILAHPEIIPQAMERYQAKEIAQRVSGLRTELETPFAGAWAGAANGDVTIVEFSDFACGFCRRSVNDVERLIKDDPKIKIVHRELPILSDQSVVAAKTALAAAKQGKYRSYYLAQFAVGPPSETNIKAAMSKAGLDSEAAQKAFLNGDLQSEIDKNMGFARQLGFSGTPTFIIGDKVLEGAVGYDELKRAVAAARAR